MLTDADVEDWNAHWQLGLPLRNLTQAQWRKIEARLPPGAQPPPEKLVEFLTAVNLFWHAAARPVPTQRAQLLAKATTGLKRVMEKLRAEGSPTAAAINRQLSLASIALSHHADAVKRLTADNFSPVGRAHFHRHEFLDAAVDLWVANGGAVRFSRPSKSGIPTGPLIRYLTSVCDIVMGKKAPKLETLAAFIVKYRQQDP